MPTQEHEAWAEMVRADPEVAAKLLDGLLDIAVPAFVSARLESSDLTQLHPTEFHADAVVALVDDDGEPALAIVVEVQRSQDATKTFTWPVYLATLRSRLKCRTMLVVLAPDKQVAKWCARPIDMGHPKWALEPLVLGPKNIPVVADPDQARQEPWFAVLSCLAHHDNEHERDATLKALLEGTKSFDEDQITQYLDVVVAGLSNLARKHLEELMGTGTNYRKPISDYFRRHYDEGEAHGEAKGLAEGILKVLASKQLVASDAERERITASEDLEQLSNWFDRALTATSVNDLFT